MQTIKHKTSKDKPHFNETESDNISPTKNYSQPIPTDNKASEIKDITEPVENIVNDIPPIQETTENYNVVPPQQISEFPTIGRLRQQYGTKNKNAEEQSDIANNPGNLTNELKPEIPQYYIAPDLSKEALLVDVALQSTVASLNTIKEAYNVTINESKELANEWKEQVKTLDSYIKSLKSIPWSSVFKYSACFFTFAAFMWKIGALRSLPQFASTVISSLPMPNTKSIAAASTEIPKPPVPSFQTIMETPLTPIGIIFSIGSLTIGLGLLKAVAWVLKKTPK